MVIRAREKQRRKVCDHLGVPGSSLGFTPSTPAIPIMSQYTISPSGIISLQGRVLTLPDISTKKFFAVVEVVRPYAEAEAKRTGVPVQWIYSIIWTETGFLGPVNGEKAISPPDKDGTSAYGRMQIKPFLFDKPTAIGDGRAHSSAEMQHDALNIRYGTDLLSIIRNDGNDLVEASSIYNCGSATVKHPWRPHPAPPYEGRAVWGVCGNVASDGLSYQDHMAAANNTYLHAKPTLVTASGGSPSSSSVVLKAIAATVGVSLAFKYLFH